MKWIGKPRTRRPSLLVSAATSPIAVAWVQAIGAFVALALSYNLARQASLEADQRSSQTTSGYLVFAVMSLQEAVGACQSRDAKKLKSALDGIELAMGLANNLQFHSLPELDASHVFGMRIQLVEARREINQAIGDSRHSCWERMLEMARERGESVGVSFYSPDPLKELMRIAKTAWPLQKTMHASVE